MNDRDVVGVTMKESEILMIQMFLNGGCQMSIITHWLQITKKSDVNGEN